MNTARKVWKKKSSNTEISPLMVMTGSMHSSVKNQENFSPIQFWKNRDKIASCPSTCPLCLLASASVQSPSPGRAEEGARTGTQDRAFSSGPASVAPHRSRFRHDFGRYDQPLYQEASVWFKSLFSRRRRRRLRTSGAAALTSAGSRC